MKKISLVILALVALATVFVGVRHQFGSQISGTLGGDVHDHNVQGAAVTDQKAVDTTTDTTTVGKNSEGTASATTPSTVTGVSDPSHGGTSVDTHSVKSNEITAVKVEHNCFSFEYKHKKEAQNRDIEDFLDLSNAFPILHSNLNKNTMCVKVNQKPVAFKLIKNKTADEVLLGSVVGPDSVIKISYCTGKAQCKETCAAPKKRFMDDLEEEANADDAFQDSWGTTPEENKKELKAKAKELRSVASENESLDSRSIVREWDTLNQNEWTCKEK